MIGYLFMAGAAFSFVALAFAYRWSESSKSNRFFMASAMGLMIGMVPLAVAIARGVNLGQADRGQWIMGVALGVIYVALIPSFMAAVARGDLSITWTLMTLSFALASGLVLIYPGETPSFQGVGGLLLAGVAVALLGIDTMRQHHNGGPPKQRKGWPFFMALSFVLNGVGLYSLSLATKLQPDSSPANKLAFLMTSGLVFAAGTLLLAFVKPQPGSVRSGLCIGLLAGTFSGTGTLCSLLALSVGVPGYILYPATSGGSSVFVVLLSVLLLKERPGVCGWLGIATGAVALTLITMAA